MLNLLDKNIPKYEKRQLLLKGALQMEETKEKKYLSIKEKSALALELAEKIKAEAENEEYEILSLVTGLIFGVGFTLTLDR